MQEPSNLANRGWRAGGPPRRAQRKRARRGGEGAVRTRGKIENPVRTTTHYVVERAQYVIINHDAINRQAELLARNDITVPRWPHKLHLITGDEQQMLTYLILLNALNFCFWSKKEKWHVVYHRKKYSGYNALALTLKNFFEEHPQQATFEYLATIPFQKFKAVLDTHGQLLLLKQRWQITRTVAQTMLKRYDSDARTLITSAQHKFSKLMPTIARTLPSFNDIAHYQEKKVYFLKRAQILAADIWGAFNSTGSGKFHDPAYLTAFADYRLPQILYHWNILEYSPMLKQKIRHHTLIPAGSPEEIEIRAATIWAVEYLRDALATHKINLYACQVDWLLWNKAQQTKKMALHHLTKTIFY